MSDLFFRLLKASSAHDLLPGSPDHLLTCARGLSDWADVLEQTGTSLRDLDAGQWTGAAADAFHAKFHTHPQKWLTAADAFTAASQATAAYAHELAAAQQRVTTAITLFRNGLQESAQAKARHAQAVAATRRQELAGAFGGVIIRLPDPAFVDTGAPMIAQAVQTVQRAIETTFAAGVSAADTVKRATEHAPKKPSLWSHMVGGTENVATATVGGTIRLSQAAYNDVLVPTVNGAAAFGQAIVHDPADTAKAVSGLLMVGAGGALEGAGGALDVTGVGAAVGAPLNVAGATVTGTGTVLTGVGATGLAAQAATEDANIMHATGRGSFGSRKPAHVADVKLTRDGQVVHQETVTSGNMTPEEAALGFPRSSLATHTEARALNGADLRAGDTMEIDGKYPPCPSCKGVMNQAAANTGAKIVYRWPGGEWVAGG